MVRLHRYTPAARITSVQSIAGTASAVSPCPSDAGRALRHTIMRPLRLVPRGAIAKGGRGDRRDVYDGTLWQAIDGTSR